MRAEGQTKSNWPPLTDYFTALVFFYLVIILSLSFRCGKAECVDKAEPYNCLSREVFTKEKQAWCCENKGLGCPDKCRAAGDCEDYAHTCVEGYCKAKKSECMNCLVVRAGVEQNTYLMMRVG